MASVNYGRERPTPPHVDPDAPAAQNLSPAFRVSPGSPLGKLRAANKGRTNDQVENSTAAAKGYDPPAKSRYNHR
jgi:hypothetical protein